VVGEGTGVTVPPSDPGKEKTYVIYPNPSSRIANVLFNEEVNDPMILQLFNNIGRLVYAVEISPGTRSVEIPVDQYPQGLYLLRFSTQQKVLSTSKIIIAR
jgi:hypothetical protein